MGTNMTAKLDAKEKKILNKGQEKTVDVIGLMKRIKIKSLERY